jgi:prepilin-type N-terminal cleavage/methylation domain-containing protein
VRICPCKRGFSLIELLVVLGIGFVILALLMPAITGGRETANAASCRNTMKQLGLALHLYQNAQERFPMGYVAWKSDDPLKTDPGWAWPAMILPHLEQNPMHRTIDFNGSLDTAAGLRIGATTLRAFKCASDRAAVNFRATTETGETVATLAPMSYAGNYGSGGDVAGQPGRGNGFFVRNRCFVLDDFEDGLSNTIAVGERATMHTKTTWAGAFDGAVCRITPGASSQSKKIGRGAVQVLAHVGDKPLNSLDSDPDEFFSPHVGGVHFLMGDGAVRFIRSTISQATLRAHASRNGVELISDAKH